ncbi:MAG TPA: type II CAAX endopeptidase family protein [Polyangia bacterium]
MLTFVIIELLAMFAWLGLGLVARLFPTWLAVPWTLAVVASYLMRRYTTAQADERARWDVRRMNKWWASVACTAMGLACVPLALILVFGIQATPEDHANLKETFVVSGHQFIVAVLLAPLVEERAFRGRIQPALCERWHPAIAVAVTAMGFAALHIDVTGLPTLAIFGVLAGTAAFMSGSLWPSIVLHATHNATIFALKALVLVDGLPRASANTRAWGALLCAIGVALFWGAWRLRPRAFALIPDREQSGVVDGAT